jgi:hypothetical protein
MAPRPPAMWPWWSLVHAHSWAFHPCHTCCACRASGVRTVGPWSTWQSAGPASSTLVQPQDCAESQSHSWKTACAWRLHCIGPGCPEILCTPCPFQKGLSTGIHYLWGPEASPAVPNPE